MWPPTACSSVQSGSSSLSASLFPACFYELIIPLFLLGRLTLPFHPHSLEAPDSNARLPPASRLPREMAHEESVECPQETLPWSRPHSSFNTGRKIKKKKENSQEFGDGREAGCVRTTHFFPAWPGVCQTVWTASMAAHGNRMSRMGTARGSRGSLEVAGPRRAAPRGVTFVLTPSPLLDSREQCRQATAC